MSPKEIIYLWVECFNQKDLDKLMNLYAIDAINHQVVFDPIVGHENIRAMFAKEFAQFDMNCIIENVFEDNKWAILEWKDPLGLRGCGFFHIIDQKIHFQRGYWDQLTFSKQQDKGERN
ncbi:MAG: nuclear transport factor 2 family protein [Brevinema sp.]